MSNIIDYAKKNKNKTFTDVPFTRVDSLIFSQLAYLSFDDYVFSYHENKSSLLLKELKNHKNKEVLYHGIIMQKETMELVDVLANSLRYGNVKINYYTVIFDAENTQQFCAVTFLLDEFTYLAFRGTDTSIVGWREDFELTFLSPIPAQVSAMKYINVVGNLTCGDMIVSGHSKGGNLAVFGSVNANEDVQKKIIQVYNHDGPGFNDLVLASPLYKKMEDKIITVLPYSSLVGMLLQQQKDFHVVKSSRFSIMQHDPFSWLVDENDFIYEKELKESSKIFAQSLNEWLNEIPHDKRKLFVDSLFEIISASGIEEFSELSDNTRTKCLKMLELTKTLDSELMEFLFKMISSLFIHTAEMLKDNKIESIKKTLCSYEEKFINTIKSLSQ